MFGTIAFPFEATTAKSSLFWE